MNDQTGHRIPWFTIFFGICALVSFLNISGRLSGGPVYNVMSTYGIVPPSVMRGGMGDTPVPQSISVTSAAPSVPPMAIEEMGSLKADSNAAGIAIQPYYPGYGASADVNDTREFNKMYYSATMRSRDVPALTRSVETTVRGHGGRVDQTQSSDQSGYISFVMPQSKFDAFRDELEQLVNHRFLSISVNSQNMLPQKQSIEAQQDYAQMSVDQLSAARKKENSDHASKMQELQYQIDANDRESQMLAQNTSADQNVRSNIVSRQMDLMTEQTNLRNKLKYEDVAHLQRINAIDAQLEYANQSVDSAKKADKDLLDDVATVNGTVSIQYIDLWELAQAYLPGYSIPIMFLVLAMISYVFERRRT